MLVLLPNPPFPSDSATRSSLTRSRTFKLAMNCRTSLWLGSIKA
jgi:hypothetical protein